MSLFDRLRKSKQSNSATAIGAISLLRAAHQQVTPAQNSKIASIAVATVLRQEAEQQTITLLARFRLHLCEHDPEPALIARVNNICYQLVQVGGWRFEEAMAAAAVWVTQQPAHPDEQRFTDVLRLSQQMRRKSGPNAE